MLQHQNLKHTGSARLTWQRCSRSTCVSVLARTVPKVSAPGAIEVGSAPKPPRTISEAVQQARNALRLYREAAAQPAASVAGHDDDEVAGPQLLRVDLPLPARKEGFLGRTDTSVSAELIQLLDEGDWPGGDVQKFRALKKLVDRMLEGYNAEFLGFLEDGADGVGLWAMPGMTFVANITSATVPSLVKLLDGGYGAKVKQPGHAVVVVNATWTDSNSVGQPWQWGLRKRAAELLKDESWETLYTCRVLRGGRGANGMLHRAWPHRWALYPAVTADARYLGECLLASASKPASRQMLDLLNEAKPAMKARAKQEGIDDDMGWF